MEMETFKAYVAAIIATIVAVFGPFVFTFAVASFAPILGSPALVIGLVAIPALSFMALDWTA